jgi:hypothetical protein
MINERKYWLAACFILLCITLFTCKCGGNKNTIESSRSDTIYHKDSVMVYTMPAHTGTIPATPQSNAGFVSRKPTTILKRDTIFLSKDSKSQSEYAYNCDKIIRDYYASEIYFDSIRTKYGMINIYDTISENDVLGRRVNVDWSIPEITNTITKTEKPRGQLYFGAEAYGTPVFYAAGTSLTWKTKDNMMYDVGAAVSVDKSLLYRVGFKRLISFKKK